MLLEYEKIGSSFVQKRDLSLVNEDKVFKGSDYNHFLTVKWTFVTAEEDATMSCVPTLTIKRSDGVLNGPIVYDAGSFVETISGSNTTYSWTFSLTANDVARKGAIQLTPSFLYKATSSDLVQIKTSTTAIMTVFDATVSGNNIIVLDESDIDTVVVNVQSSIDSLTANFDNYYTKANTTKRYEVDDIANNDDTNLIALCDTFTEETGAVSIVQSKGTNVYNHLLFNQKIYYDGTTHYNQSLLSIDLDGYLIYKSREKTSDDSWSLFTPSDTIASEYYVIAKFVQTVNGKFQDGAVTLNQDEIPDGTTYKQFSLDEKTKLALYPVVSAYGGTTVTDLDAIEYSNFYSADEDATGNPFISTIHLLHINGSASTHTAYQMAISTDTGAKKERIKLAGTWGDWREFALCEAKNTGFDNSGTDLSSIDVQSAIVEVNTKINTNTEGIEANTENIGINAGLIEDLESDKLDKAPDGTNNLLGVNDKLNTVYIPDWLLGSMVYGGTFNATTFVATLTTDAQAKLGTSEATITLTNDDTAITGYDDNLGIYYIVSTAGTFASKEFAINDKIIGSGSFWDKTDNTDSVSSVNGKVGTVVLDASDVGALPTTGGTLTGDLIFDNTAARNIKMGANIAIQMNIGGDIFVCGGTTSRYIYFRPQGTANETGVWYMNASRLAPANNNASEIGFETLRIKQFWSYKADLLATASSLDTLVINSTETDAYSRVKVSADGRIYTFGVGGSTAPITEFRNAFYLYDETNSRKCFTYKDGVFNAYDINGANPTDLLAEATTTTKGLMSASDKTKLDSLNNIIYIKDVPLSLSDIIAGTNTYFGAYDKDGVIEIYPRLEIDHRLYHYRLTATEPASNLVIKMFNSRYLTPSENDRTEQKCMLTIGKPSAFTTYGITFNLYYTNDSDGDGAKVRPRIINNAGTLTTSVTDLTALDTKFETTFDVNSNDIWYTTVIA